MSEERKIAVVGDYVTTTTQTFDVAYSAGKPFLMSTKPCGIRQGIVTGQILDRNIEEKYGETAPYYIVRGEIGIYAVPKIEDLVVVDSKSIDRSTRYALDRIHEESRHLRVAALIAAAYKAGYHNGASNYIGESDSDLDMQIAQNESWDTNKAEYLDEFLGIQI